MIFKVGRLFYLSDHSICDYLHLFEKVNMQEGITFAFTRVCMCEGDFNWLIIL